MADEYISREKAKAEIRKKFPVLAERIEINGVLNFVPAADVQPVRHGRWIDHGWTTVCSVCGEDYPFARRNYCPNCGARMDGGETAWQ